MARSVNTLEREEQYGLAKYEDVNHNEMTKRFYESVDREAMKPKPAEEVKLEEDLAKAAFLAEFLDLDDMKEAVQSGDLEVINQKMTETANVQEAIKSAEESLEQILKEESIDENGNPAAMVAEDLGADQKDPFSQELFTQRSTRKRKTVPESQEQRRALTMQDDAEYAYQEHNRTQGSGSGSSYFNSTSSSRGTSGYGSTSTDSSNNNTHSAKVEQSRKFYDRAAGSVKEATYNQRLEKRDKERTRIDKAKKQQRKQKLTLRTAFSRVKTWFKSHEASELMKIGSLICIETALAIITGKHDFDGKGQLLAFLGLMTGLYYVGQKVWALGIDPRLVKF